MGRIAPPRMMKGRLAPDRSLARFARAFPSVQLHVHAGYSTDLAAAFDRHEFDAVLLLDKLGNTKKGAVLESSQMVWIGPEVFAQDRRLPLPIATFDNPCGFHKAATATLDRACIPWRLVCTTTSVAGLIAAVRAGIAVTARTPHALQPGTALVQAELALPGLPQFDIVLMRSKSMSAGDTLEQMLQETPLFVA